MEGAGVHLRRAFGFGDTTEFDPFLLFDDFRNDRPADYLAGFPWHPHRGIETITYVLAGTVAHGDSLGNKGNLGAGDVQWMTAGSGIVHQEMPQGDAAGRMHGFQLWANLPASLKMTTPRYQDVTAKGHPRSRRRRRHAACESCAAASGASADPSTASLPIRTTSISRFRPADAGRCQSRRRVTPSLTSSPAAASSVDASSPRTVATEDMHGELAPSLRSVGNRSLVLFDRGDEVVVQAGDEGHALSARLRKTARRSRSPGTDRS
jgi:redox-sensitive bicupin YhaK (pirin superfamily)